MQAIPEGLLSAASERYRVAPSSTAALSGGSASNVWRLDSVPPVVVRVSQYYQLKDLQRSCQVASAMSRMIPEAIAPLIGSDGEAAFLCDGLPVTVWSFVDGAPLDRQNLVQLRQAAGLLGRLHKAVLACPGLGDGQSPDRDDSAAVRLLPDGELDEWLRSWREGDAAREHVGWMHRDFFPDNILCRQQEIVGLVDWDEVEWGPMITELAISVWEFANHVCHGQTTFHGQDHGQTMGGFDVRGRVLAGGTSRPHGLDPIVVRHPCLTARRRASLAPSERPRCPRAKEHVVAGRSLPGKTQ